MLTRQQKTVVFSGVLLFGLSLTTVLLKNIKVFDDGKRMKLYWFIPDGLRAEPDIFKIYEWAEQGHLPNLKKMMEQGAYGYSIPVFPTHTPVNFATLFTGTTPKYHGVSDGPIRLPGYPLEIVPTSGFNSTAKKQEPLWFTLEQKGLASSLLSVPGSTPPETSDGIVIKGRWGNWGVEFPSIVFHTSRDHEFRRELGWNDRVFNIGKRLTRFVDPVDPAAWTEAPVSHSPPREVNFHNWQADLFALITDGTDDGVENYDRLHLSLDRKKILQTLAPGEWSDWHDIDLYYQTQKTYQDGHPQKAEWEQQLTKIKIATKFKVKAMKLGRRDFFRVRVLYDGMNESQVKPYDLAEPMREQTGPMVDNVDNYPPQLIYYPEDKQTFLEESDMSFDWHAHAADYLMKNQPQDVFIHNIYSPNQMLTSRWWMGRMDQESVDYSSYSPEEKARAHGEVLAMYRHVDRILGQAMARLPKDGFLVFSSDHGVAPLNYEVRLNNLFQKKGWLRFFYDKELETHRVDWRKTKAVFLKMNHIYLNPHGLHGDYRPGKGAEYERFRGQVAQALRELKDENGVSPLSHIYKREEADQIGLPDDRVGDLVIANRVGYNWVEDMSEDGLIFIKSLKAGYKQAIIPEDSKSLWTPFAVIGPGIKRGYKIERPISHLQQYPTIMKLLDQTPPHKTDMGPLDEIFE